MRILILIFLGITLLNAEDLGVVEINDKSDIEIEQNAFEGVFEEPEYEEAPEYIQGMPSQKRMTKEEAMFIPGVKGDPVKALTSMSGVTTMSDGRGELMIYGSKPEESLTTINHLPIGYLFHMGGLHSVISPDSISQIDAYMAGFDATYGDAMGGVINITPEYPKDEFSGYGHVGIFDASAGVNVALSDDVSFYLGARRSYFDLALAAIGKSTGTISEEDQTSYVEFPNYYDVSFTMAYQPNSDNTYSIELISANDSLEVATYKYEEVNPELAGEIKAQFGFTTLGARHQGFYGDYETNTLVYSMYNTNRTELFEDFFIDIESFDNGFFHQSTYTLNNHKLIAGIEFKNIIAPLKLNIFPKPSDGEDILDSNTSDVRSYDNTLIVNNGTLFLEDIYKVSDSFIFRTGVRFSYSDYENFGGYIDPRFSMLYNINKENELSFSTGIYSQIPEGSKTIDEFGNPDSSYERAAHYVAHYGNSSFKNTTISIDTFYKDYFDLLIKDDLTRYENGGVGYAYGVDSNIKMRLNQYYLYGAYTYLRSKRELNTADDALTRFYGEIPHTAQIIGGVKFWDNWAFSTRVHYHSGAPYTKITGVDVNGEPEYDDINAGRLPDYFTLNVKIAQQIKLSKSESIEWSFEIMNLTNNENVTGINYDENYNEIGYKTDLPILPWLDVTYRF